MRNTTIVLLVDGQALVGEGISDFLETRTDITVVAETGSGEEAVKHAPHVALVGLIMPVINGVEATRHLTVVSPRTSVVLFTSYHDDEHVFPAVRAGVLYYVLKEVGRVELADAIRKAANPPNSLSATPIDEPYGRNAPENPEIMLVARPIRQVPGTSATWASGGARLVSNSSTEMSLLPPRGPVVKGVRTNPTRAIRKRRPASKGEFIPTVLAGRMVPGVDHACRWQGRYNATRFTP